MPKQKTVKQWCFYLIQNGTHTYAGISNDPMRRLRCHNGEIKGGSRHTKIIGPGWTHVCIIHGFDQRGAIQFEYAIKHPVVSGIQSRVAKVVSVMHREKWTPKSKPSTSYHLYMIWYDAIANAPIDLPENVQITYNID